MPINIEVMKKWVVALESGEYKQGRSLLKGSNNNFCCLGVLCDIFVKEHPRVARWSDHEIIINQKGDERYSLPETVSEWAGFVDYASDPIIDDNETSCIKANDDLEYDFKTIARMIKEKYIYGEDPNEIP